MSFYSGLHRMVFSSISVIYGLFFSIGWKKYRETIAANLELFGDDKPIKLLDVGCGTGAFTYALHMEGMDVTGTDISDAMMNKARSKNLNCVRADINAGLPFADNSFDIVCAAYVAHGMKKRYRKKLYEETGRIAARRVIFHDYGGKLSPLPVLFIELLEILVGADYFGFRKNAFKEMQAFFPEVRVKPVSPSVSWYICEIEARTNSV